MSSATLLMLTVLGVAIAWPDRYHPVQLEQSTYIVDPAENTAEFWYNEAKVAIQKRSKYDTDENVARKLVLVMGDGLSVPTMGGARILKGQRAGNTGEEEELFFETFPTVGLVKTYCVDQQIPDSACTATAFLSGIKNIHGTTGVTAAVQRRDCEASLVEANQVQSIADWALAAGMDVGVVTTTQLTDASPAALYAKIANRVWESDTDVMNEGQDPARCIDIAQQLVTKAPGNQLKVILGGGRQQFIPNTTVDEDGTPGRRSDGRDLIEEWQQDKIIRNLSHAYIRNREEMTALYDSPPEYLLGIFNSDHLSYNLDRNTTKEPSLEELTEMAIRMLSRNEKGFFLFIEGGRIDHAHHDNLVQLALDETIEMDKAIEKAAEMLGEEDSLIVVTSDHTHVMAFNGYSPRGHPILGVGNMLDLNRVPFMTLSYTNGPGARPQVDGVRQDPREEPDFGEIFWPSHADVITRTETHGGDDVPVFARGPHHRLFTGLYEQSQIPHIMAYAACIGPGIHADACNAAGSVQTTAVVLTFATVFYILIR